MIKLNCCIPSLLIPPPLGVVSLSQALCSADDYSNSLLHLDLSKNPGVLSGEDATVRHKNCCIVCSHSNILMHTYCKKILSGGGGKRNPDSVSLRSEKTFFSPAADSEGQNASFWSYQTTGASSSLLQSLPCASWQTVAEMPALFKE